MAAMRAISASRPAHEPARHGATRTAPSADRAAFPAALKAAADGDGPAVAVVNEPPQPDPLPSRPPLASGRSEPGAAFALFAAAADHLDPLAAGPSASLGVDGESVAGHRSDPRSGIAAAPSAAAAPAVPLAAKADTDPGSARRVLSLPLVPIALLAEPGAGETGSGKTSSIHAGGPAHPPQERREGHSHPLPQHAGAAVPAAAGILAAAAAPGLVAASPPLSRPAPATGSAAGNPTERSAARRPAPADGSRSQPPTAAGSQPATGSVPRAALDNAGITWQTPPDLGAAALPAAGGPGPDRSHAPAAAGIAAPPGATGDGGNAPSGSAPPAGGPNPAGASASAPTAPPPHVARNGETPSVPSPLPATARVGARPASSPGDGAAAPTRPSLHTAGPPVMPMDPTASGTNAPPAAGAGAAKPGSPAAAPNPSPSNLAGQLSGPVMGALANGHRDLSLHLHPPELGDVSVRLVVSGRTVSAWFDSPQPQVQQAIGQGIGQLHADLASAGYDLGGAWVGGQAWTPRERGGSPLAPRPVRPAAAGAPVPEARGAAPAAAGSGVSVYV